ncbi:MAG: hypothetical protein B6I33_06355 [Propionibacterium sp. 4572_24]|nr:MAG: hypothetical protein B6I33_06355 [Propionibacterium sp. 4572_24]
MTDLAPRIKGYSVINIDQPACRTVLEVEQHNGAVCQPGAARACYREFCARCQAKGPFSPHDLRQRGLRAVANQMVLSMTVWLARWRCRKCRYVFTDYPDFRTSL